MYGADSRGVRGNTVREKSERAWDDNIGNVPCECYNPHQFVTLIVDLMLVNSVTFLVIFTHC